MGIIAISRQLGAGETTIAPALAERLGWQCIDHQILDRAVAETGATIPNASHQDENAPGRFESWTHPHEAERYFQALKRILAEYAAKGDVVIVGRGAGFVLHPRALHVRLVADMPFRLQRVMELRWTGEHHAREIIKQSDHDRAAFHRRFFNIDWNDPTHYNLVVSTSQTGIERSIAILIATATTFQP
jgi:cytidylate kinase